MRSNSSSGSNLPVAQAGTLETHLTFPGTVGLNTERVVRIVPRIPGVVREVRKRLGDGVRSGEVLAVIDSRELADAKAGYPGRRRTLRAFGVHVCPREGSLGEKDFPGTRLPSKPSRPSTEARIELQAAKHKLQAWASRRPRSNSSQAAPRGPSRAMRSSRL